MSIAEEEEEHLRRAAVVFVESFSGDQGHVGVATERLYGYLLGHLQAYRGNGNIEGSISAEEVVEVRALATEYSQTMLEAEALSA